MAFSGTSLYVTCATATNDTNPNSKNGLITGGVWSDTIASGGKGQVAFTGSERITIRLLSPVDGFYALGDNPDASKATSTNANSARFPLPALTLVDHGAQSGQFISWVAAS